MQYTYDQARSLTEAYGSPLYVVDGKRFKDTFYHLERAILSEYAPYRIAYSVKTNYMPYLCSLVRDCGGMAEVVSSMEYEIARRMGFAPSNIVFNGPRKDGALERALLEGALVVADNAFEVDRIRDIALAHPEKNLTVGVRLNFDIGNGKISRFGFDAECPHTVETVRLLKSLANVNVTAAHCHFTHARSLEKWRLRAEKMVGLAQELLGDSLKVIDLGSGMYGEMESSFAKLFGSDIPTFEDYARAIGPVMQKAFGSMPMECRPVLVTEPGTTLVANALDCITKITGIKQIRGHSFVSLDAGIHVLGELSMAKNLPLQVLHGERATDVECLSADMVGYTCLEYDVVYRGYEGPIAVGDYAVFGNVGSYSVDMKPPFILPSCAAVAFDERSEAAFLVKERESVDDVFSTYRLDF